MLVLSTSPAFAATYSPINGDISKWGVNLQEGLKGPGHESSWLPQSDTAQFVVADKIDPVLAKTSKYEYPTGTPYYDWTNYKSTGVHIIGTKALHSPYTDELLTSHPDWWSNEHGGAYLPPAGGGAYDVKALYFDDDPSNLYIAIITALPPNGVDGTYYMGDIALNLPDPNSPNTNPINYEYGIEIPIKKTGISTNCKVVNSPTWSYAPTDFTGSAPYRFNGYKKLTGTATIAYVDSKCDDTGVYTDGQAKSFTTYVIEAKIPKSAIGNPTKGQIANLHMTIGCGNDVIDLGKVHFNTQIPEFPSVVLPVAAIMGIILIFGRRKE